MPASQPSPRALLLATLVCLSLVALGPSVTPAAAQSQTQPQPQSGASYVSVTNVTHTPQTPTTGEPFEVRTVVENHAGNGGPFRINEVYVTGQGRDTYVADDLGSLPAGSSMPVTLPVTVDDPGRHTFTVVVHGTNPSGGPVVVRHPVTVQVVEETDPQVELSTQTAVPGATRPVNVTVGNGQQSALEQVSVTVSSPQVDFELRRRVQAEVGAGNTTTFRFPATVTEAGRHPVTVQLQYTDDGERYRQNQTFRAHFGAPQSPGEIALTGTDAVVQGGTLELSATASNVGTTEVQGVVVSVGGGNDVSSADYFVGSVEASDFSSFTVTTAVAGNVSSVPVEVRYLVDGVERTYTTDVPVERAAPAGPPAPERSGPPLLPIAAGVGVLLLFGGAYRVWR
jgi:VCBS repeat-containing protein